MSARIITLALTLTLQAVTATAMTDPRPLACVRSHLDHIIEHGTDRYGAHSSPRWMAALDLRTLDYPEAPLPVAGRRAYRDIHAPHGSNIYLDLPQLLAAVALSESTGEPRYAAAAHAYIAAFLRDGQARNGLLRWGHHHYYDAFADRHTCFNQGRNNGHRHELRPWCPPWELLAAVDGRATDAALRALRLHVHLPSGAFDRHAEPGGYDQPPHDCSFLEAGAVLAESFCYLASRSGEQRWNELAARIARWSYARRNATTGLVINNPTKDRWDQRVSTSEIGVWARALLRCHDLSQEQEFLDMADAALSAWLQHAWLPERQRYAGMVAVDSGEPIHLPGPYRPRELADIWHAAFPSHEYPLSLAECCVELAQRTGAPRYRTAIDRWAAIIAASPPPPRAREGYGPYAAVFGRAIHFLLRAGEATGEQRFTEQAQALAQQAIALLYDGRMFRGHAGEDRYDATDGVGFLLLALIHLERGSCPAETSGLHF